MLTLSDNILEELKQKYSEQHRVYHTWDDHIAKMLASFESRRSEFNFPDSVYLAILFHDVIYDVGENYGVNEILSNVVMLNTFKNHLPEFLETVEGKETVKLAMLMVIATEKHNPYRNEKTISAEAVEDVKKFLDLDLGILATTDKQLLIWYDDAIRQEFSSYDDLVYNAGRTKVLQNFLKRENIFFSGDVEMKNSQARENLSFLIQRLER